MRRALALAAIVILAVGGGIFWFTRAGADVDEYGGFGVWPAGKGVIVASVSATNPRDRDVELSVPEDEREWLARQGVRVSVGFKRLKSAAPDTSPEGLSATMPANASGAITHVFRVADCDRVRDLTLVRLPLEVDGHTAQVEIEPASGEHELSDYEREVLQERVRFTDCQA